MKDRYFYPFAAAVIAGMIYYALSFSVPSAPVDPDIYALSEDSLSELFPSPGTTVELAADGSGTVAYAVMGAQLRREDAPPSAGVFGTLGPVHEASFAEQDIRITVRARKGRVAPSSAFELAYFTAGVGDSAWQRFALGDEFSDHSFVFTPNAVQGKAGNDYIGIWPDPSGQKGSVDVLSVRVEKITKPTLRGGASTEGEN